MKTIKMLAVTAMVLSVAACNSNKVDGKVEGADSNIDFIPQKGPKSRLWPPFLRSLSTRRIFSLQRPRLTL